MRYRSRVDLDLSGRSVIGIAGDNEVGKSTILDVLAYNAYGRTARDGLRDVDLISRPGDGDMVTQVVWRFPDSSTLEIERGRTRKNTPVLSVAGITTRNAAEAEEAIRSKVRASFDDFRALTYFAQGQVNGFMEGNKREYLSRWTAGLVTWDRIAQRAKDRRVLCEADLIAARTREEAAEQLADTVSQAAALCRQAKAAAAAATDRYEAAQRRLDALSDKAARARAVIQGRREAREHLDYLRQATVGAVDGVHRAQAVAKEAVSSADSAKGGVCPILSIDCVALAAYKGEKLRAAARKARSALVRAQEQARYAKDAVDRCEAQLRSIRRATGEEKELVRSLADARVQRREADSLRKEAVADLSDARAQYAAAVAAGEQAEELGCEVARLEEEVSRWLFLQTMCGRNGIPAQIVEAELGEVEARCNWVLQRMGVDKEIVFRGYKLLAGYEKECGCGGSRWHKSRCVDCGEPRQRKRKDDLTVTIIEQGEERPFASQSGGAKVVVSFAVRLAAALFYGSMVGIPMRLAMLDEVFGMLDASRRKALLQLALGKLASEFSLTRQLIVSHSEDVVGAIDALLLVKSVGGESIVEWA